MKTLFSSRIALFIAVLALGLPAQAVVIDFDDLADGVAVTTQYPEATFSSDAGFVNWTTAQDLGSSLPNFICTGPETGGIDCVHTTRVDFTDPVNGLNFLAIGVDDTGVVASVDVYENGAYSTTVSVIGDGTPYVPDPVDLSVYGSVTTIIIHTIVDSAGIGWDDFYFIPEDVASEQTSWSGIKALY